MAAGRRRQRPARHDRGPAFTAWTAQWFADAGYRVQINDPYQGGDLLTALADPARQRHSIRSSSIALCMDEAAFAKHVGFATLKRSVDAYLDALADYVRARIAPQETRMTTYIVDAVDSALKLLTYVAEHPNLGVTELASQLGINKSRTYRMLCTLELHRFVVQDPRTSTYALGPQAFVIGVAASQQNALVRAAHRHMLALNRAINETIVLRARETESVCVARCETTHAVRTVGAVGNRRPINFGASGKVLLAFAPDPVRDDAISRNCAETGTPTIRRSSPANSTRRAQRLRGEQRRGDARRGRDRGAGARPDGATVASVSVTGSRVRVSHADIPDYLERLRACSLAISAELGYVPARAAPATGLTARFASDEDPMSASSPNPAGARAADATTLAAPADAATHDAPGNAPGDASARRPRAASARQDAASGRDDAVGAGGRALNVVRRFRRASATAAGAYHVVPKTTRCDARCTGSQPQHAHACDARERRLGIRRDTGRIAEERAADRDGDVRRRDVRRDAPHRRGRRGHRPSAGSPATMRTC